MDCQKAQEEMLNSLTETRAIAPTPDLRIHLTSCAACRSFLETHNMLDRQLSTLVSAPMLSPAFRGALRKRVKHDPLGVWPTFLPDLAHAVGCMSATAVCVVMLPIPAGMVMLGGLAFGLASYFAQTVLRAALESWEEGYG